jgi:hypothetical protein
MKPGLIEASEPLITDERLDQVVSKLKAEFGREKLEQTEFVTFIQPEKRTNRTTESGITVPTIVPDMAVFAVLSPNPRPGAKAVGAKVMTHGTAALVDWRESESERSHYVAGRRDPAHEIFRGVVREHLRVMTNLKEMI